MWGTRGALHVVGLPNQLSNSGSDWPGGELAEESLRGKALKRIHQEKGCRVEIERLGPAIDSAEEGGRLGFPVGDMRCAVLNATNTCQLPSYSHLGWLSG